MNSTDTSSDSEPHPPVPNSSRNGYLATVAAIGLGSGAAGVIGLVLGFLYGLVVVFAIGSVLTGSSDAFSETTLDTAFQLMPVVIGVPCMAMSTASATYWLVEARSAPGWVPQPIFEAGRETVWSAALVSSIAFAAVALVTPTALFTLMLRVWLWPLYVLPVGIAARWIAVRCSRSRGTQTPRSSMSSYARPW